MLNNCKIEKKPYYERKVANNHNKHSCLIQSLIFMINSYNSYGLEMYWKSNNLLLDLNSDTISLITR
jgi:hypothetical protein